MPTSSRLLRACALRYFTLLAVLTANALGRLSLDGERLNCCTILETPIIFRSPRNQPHGFDGLAIDYLNRLQTRLNFTCGTLTEFAEKNVGFTAFIKKLGACSSGDAAPDSPVCKCDLGVGGWMLSEERLGLVDYLPSYIRDELKVLVHVHSTTTSTGGAFFLTAFSPSVWISIAGLVVTFTFLKLLDKRFAPQVSPFTPLSPSESRFRRCKYFLLKSRIPFRLRRAVQSVFSKMIGQSIGEIRGDFSSTRQWVLNFAIVLCGLFLVLVYEATMTASLVQENVVSDFRSLKDLKFCHIPTSDVCILRGGIVETFWRNGIATQECHQGQKVTMYNSFDEAVKKVAEKKCKFLITDGATTGNAQHGRYCREMIETGKPFFQNGLSFVLPRGSNRTKHMSAGTLQLHEEDVLESLEQYFARDGLCGAERRPSLTFQKLQIFFYLAFGACFCIFLELVLDPQSVSTQESQDSLSEVISDYTISSASANTVTKEKLSQSK